MSPRSFENSDAMSLGSSSMDELGNYASDTNASDKNKEKKPLIKKSLTKEGVNTVAN
jgi:hypothetical protein